MKRRIEKKNKQDTNEKTNKHKQTEKLQENNTKKLEATTESILKGGKEKQQQ